MENEPEVTREQMFETRASLSEKLETLEQHVVDTVQGATTAVAETVENVKDAVHETVATVKNTFNLHLQVRRHPWGMVGGSIALGCLGGYLLFRNRSHQSGIRGQESGIRNQQETSLTPDSRLLTPVVKRHRSVDKASSGIRNQQETALTPDSRLLTPGPGWLSGVTDQFGTEITKLKGLAIGTVLSVVRDMITQPMSKPMKAQLAGVMDSMTVKLGGEPIPCPASKDGAYARGKDHPELVSDGRTAGSNSAAKLTNGQFA